MAEIDARAKHRGAKDGDRASFVVLPYDYSISDEDRPDICLKVSEAAGYFHDSEFFLKTCGDRLHRYASGIKAELSEKGRAKRVIAVEVEMDKPAGEIFGAYSPEENVNYSMLFAIENVREACSQIKGITCLVFATDPEGYFKIAGIKAWDEVPFRPEGRGPIVMANKKLRL